MGSPAPAVGLLTDAASAGLDEDQPRLEAALRSLGATSHVLVWDDPERPLRTAAAALDVVVVRSAWGYHEHAERYVAALEELAAVTAVHNPPATVRWNIDKRYLAELARGGCRITPTAYVPPGTDPEPALARFRDGSIVVKPTVSAGSRNTARYGPAERPAAERHIVDLHAAAKTAMVQPYLSAVDEHGETGLVFIDGQFSHAIRKGPLLAPGGALVEGLFAPEEISAREPSAAERDEADRVMALIAGRFGPLLYARVDLLAGPDGRPRLLEVELNEPSLFLAQDPASAERLAAAILTRLAVRRS